MKVYKVELLIVDHEEVGAEGIKEVLEGTRYPSISPEVKSVQEKDIGEWDDDHPLNDMDTADQASKELFCPYCHSDNEAIKGTYFDQTCKGCVKRMGKQ